MIVVAKERVKGRKNGRGELWSSAATVDAIKCECERESRYREFLTARMIERHGRKCSTKGGDTESVGFKMIGERCFVTDNGRKKKPR